jgi:HlyD family type I secretion membrane fusion protein
MAKLSVVRQAPVVFGAGGEEDVPDHLWGRIRRTIWIGCVVAAIFIAGVGVWAALSPVAGAVSASGFVKVESSRKTIKHLEPGIVRQILVHEGDHVAKGELLFVFDDSQPKALLAELQSAYDSATADRARFEAEAANRPEISFPPELLSRRADPAVSALIAAQEALFRARRDVLRSQEQIGHQRQQELGTQIDGLRAQVAATDAELALNKDELGGVQTLYAGGYAPKTRLLALQRSSASLGGTRGDQVSSIARAEQAIGETRIQTLQSEQTRISEAATGLETSGDKIADIGARLAAAKDSLSHAKVYSPTDGTVLNLTQFTEGGVVGAGEPLLDVVPTGEPLTLSVRVEPRDAHAVRPGQKALITLSAFNSRTTPRITAEVTTLSADQTIDAHTGKPYFTAELRIPPDQLRRLPPDVKIYPGMPVSTSIVNGERTVLSYLVGPIADMFRQSMHEQ